jgi:hypothetical protein
MNRSFSIILTEEETNCILSILSEVKFSVSAPIIATIQRQAQGQLSGDMPVSDASSQEKTEQNKK